MNIEVLKDIKVEVNNNGEITFISKEKGTFCIINVHPFDNSQLVKFLVKNGYSFCP